MLPESRSKRSPGLRSSSFGRTRGGDELAVLVHSPLRMVPSSRGTFYLSSFCVSRSPYESDSSFLSSRQIALRMAIFNCASPVGAMLSGALQGALSTNLEGSLGRAGWRWAFIINGVMTIAVACAGFFLLPVRLSLSFYMSFLSFLPNVSLPSLTDVYLSHLLSNHRDT